MLFAIHMIDRADSEELRAQTADEHRAFVGKQQGGLSPYTCTRTGDESHTIV